MRDFGKHNIIVDLGLWINMQRNTARKFIQEKSSLENKESGHQADLSCRYAFDVLGELFYGKTFGFISERTDIGDR